MATKRKTFISSGAGEIESNNRRLKTSKKAVEITEKHLKAAKDEVESVINEVEARRDALKTDEDVMQAQMNALKGAVKNVEARRDELKKDEDKLVAARKAAEEAQHDYDEAHIDMTDAKACCEAAEEKWEVNDLVNDGDDYDNVKKGSVESSDNKQDDELRAKMSNDALYLFEPGLVVHRETTFDCLVASASRGESSVPLKDMTKARNKTMSRMAHINEMLKSTYNGTCFTTEELRKKMLNAEAEAVKKYVEHTKKIMNQKETVRVSLV